MSVEDASVVTSMYVILLLDEFLMNFQSFINKLFMISRECMNQSFLKETKVFFI